MEDAPEPGPAKKPRSTTPRTAAARKPATTRTPAAKPAVKTTAKPATKATAKPAPKRPATPRAKPATPAVIEAEAAKTPEIVVENVVETPEDVPEEAVADDEVLESETVLDEPESAFDPEAAEDVVEATEEVVTVEPGPESRPEPARVTIGRFSLPKLTLPKLVVPTLGRARTQQPAEIVSDVASDAPEVEEIAVDDETAGEEVEDEATRDEPVEEEPEPESEVIEAVIVEESTAVAKKAPRKKRTKADTVLRVEALSKHFDETIAVDSIDLDVQVGSFYGIVGPNGAGKTTTLSMITGLLRPDAGRVLVHGADVWSDPATAKRNMGVLPDRLRLFDRLTGAQLLHYAGVLRGLDNATVTARASDLADALGLEDAMSRLVSDYSAGMTKKIALAAAMIHSPRLLVLDEPFESVDPVSAATVTDILKSYAAAGGTVVLSSHNMDLVQRTCDSVAVIAHGKLLADGTMDEVRDGQTLEERFVSLVSSTRVEGMEWLHSFSD